MSKLMMSLSGERMLKSLERLSSFGRDGDAITRRALTPPDHAAREWLLVQMREAGLEAFIDGIGNVIGRTPGSARYLVIGSHTDSVPKGGCLDGAYGVMAGLEVARAWQLTSPGGTVGIEVVSFMDEEGYYTPMLGSQVYAGVIAANVAREMKNSSGERLADVLNALSLSERPVATVSSVDHIGFLEAHIEQGPILEAGGHRIGVVTGIMGVRRFYVRFTGQADHTGTTPMSMRRDAAAALYQCAYGFQQYCRSLERDELVWNVGHCVVEPNAFNVVASAAVLGVEFRSTDSAILEQIVTRIPALAQSAALEKRVGVSVERCAHVDPTPMDARLIEAVASSAQEFALQAIRMRSGAGHDAMTLAKVLPAAMVFVPSQNGRSHDASEYSTPEQLVDGLRVLARTAERLVA